MQENSRNDLWRTGGRWAVILAAFGALAAFGTLFFAAPRVAGLLLSSAAVVIPAALLSLSVGVPIALLAAKTDAPFRRAVPILALSLVLLPLHILASAWMGALGDQGGSPALLVAGGRVGGWLVGYSGAIFLHGVAGAPWAVLLSLAALRSVDRRLEETALLDASPLRVLLRVTLRGAAPALAAAAVLLAVLAAGEMTITDLLRVRTFAEEVYTQAATGELLDPAAGASWRLGLGVLALGLASAAAMMTFVGRVLPEREREGLLPWRATVAWPRVAGAALLAVVVLLVGVPVASLAHRAGVVVEPVEGVATRYWSAAKLASSVAMAPWQHRRELGVSLTLAACVACGATALGGAVAWSMRRWPTGWCFALAILLAVPGPVIGLTVIRLLNQPVDSPLAWLGDLYGTWFAPWLAQMVRITPAIALVLWPAALRVPAELFDAAKCDGAGPAARLRWIIAPSMAPALAAVWLAAFALSLGELSATILVVPPGTPPLSVRLLSLLHYGVEDRVAAISLVLIAGYVLIALAVARLLPLGRRTG